MAEPLGVKVPIGMGQTGYFDQTFTSIDEAKANMLNLILKNRSVSDFNASKFLSTGFEHPYLQTHSAVYLSGYI